MRIIFNIIYSGINIVELILFYQHEHIININIKY
jgi:hypothetical protein